MWSFHVVFVSATVLEQYGPSIHNFSKQMGHLNILYLWKIINPRHLSQYSYMSSNILHKGVGEVEIPILGINYWFLSVQIYLEIELEFPLSPTFEFS